MVKYFHVVLVRFHDFVYFFASAYDALALGPIRQSDGISNIVVYFFPVYFIYSI